MASQPRGTALTIAQDLGQRLTQFEAALAGTGVSPKRFMRVVLTATNINPDLLNCDRRSLMNSAIRAASDGLVPDGIDGALVPFDGKVTWMPMVQGIRKKVRRSGEVTSWDVTAVFAKDAFDYELGDDPFIKHRPWMAPELVRHEGEADKDYNARLRKHLDRGPLTYVYSVATIKGGDKSRDVMTRAPRSSWCATLTHAKTKPASFRPHGADLSPRWRRRRSPAGTPSRCQCRPMFSPCCLVTMSYMICTEIAPVACRRPACWTIAWSFSQESMQRPENFSNLWVGLRLPRRRARPPMMLPSE